MKRKNADRIRMAAWIENAPNRITHVTDADLRRWVALALECQEESRVCVPLRLHVELTDNILHVLAPHALKGEKP